MSRPDRGGEPLVLDTHHPAALEGEVAAQDQAQGVPPGGPVEGLGHRGPPVDHQRLVVGAVDGQAADVEGLGLRTAAVGPVPSAAPSATRSIRPKVRAWSPMSSCSSRARLVRTITSRSVRDWKVPPRPRSRTPSSMELASPRMASRRA